MKVKVGDIVQLVSKRPGVWNYSGLMDKFLGKITTITSISGIYITIDLKGSNQWCFTINDIEKIVKSNKMNIKKTIQKVANSLLKANNTVTTLEIKTELRKQFPKVKWNQSDISQTMMSLSNDGEYNFTDNGVYRVYSFSNVKANTPNPVSKTLTKQTSTTSKTQRVSRTKAIDLLQNTNGRYFGVTFTKKDGTVRKMKCKVEGDAKPTSLGYLLVKDVAEAKPKSLNLQTVSELRMNKTTYKVG